MPLRPDTRTVRTRPFAKRPALSCLFLAMMAAGSASAIEIDTGNPDWKLRWDNTLKYSLMTRLERPLPELSTSGINLANQNDGNNNFKRGLVSSRVDWLTELDLAGPGYGARVSAAAWYDSVYNGKTDNPGVTPNHIPASEFTSETRKLMGRDAELLDAFVYANFDLGEKPATVRVGRHTLLWGESLFFGGNGIAGGQAPLDLVKLLSVPNSTFKEVARPTGKISGQVQLSSDMSLGGYLTYDWQKTRLIPVGAYLSVSDTQGPGSERLLGPGFVNGGDVDAKDSGQGGLQLRFRVPSIDTDFGLYAIRYHATGPSNINFTPPNYRWLYHEGIKAYGASFAKSVGEWGLAGEVSVRQNTPLASRAVAGSFANNSSNPGYAVGETAHAQFSWLASLGPSFISQEASFVGEVAWNKRLKVTHRSDLLNPNADESAVAMRMVYAPTYRQVTPGLDLTPSVGLGYAWGKSSAVGPAFGVDKGGDLSLGLAATYLGKWNFGVNYVRYLGTAAPVQDALNLVQYQQALKDRDYLSLSVRTTF